MDRQKIGKDAEKAAEQYLRKKKLKFLTRNFHCRFGEIDLIMLDGNTLVFIEVRCRRSEAYGGAITSVTTTKQRRIIRTAEFYLSQNKSSANKNCRFDVIAFKYDAAPTKPLWYKDAFRP